MRRFVALLLVFAIGCPACFAGFAQSQGSPADNVRSSTGYKILTDRGFVPDSKQAAKEDSLGKELAVHIRAA